jgi:hypothetical protein
MPLDIQPIPVMPPNRQPITVVYPGVVTVYHDGLSTQTVRTAPREMLAFEHGPTIAKPNLIIVEDFGGNIHVVSKDIIFRNK